jgi:hypothetical protein
MLQRIDNALPGEPLTASFDMMGGKSMSCQTEYRRFAVSSLDLSERGETLADKSRVLIVAEAWLDLAEQTTQLVERETGEAHRIAEQPLNGVTLKSVPSRP